jgi:hypothetical protein
MKKKERREFYALIILLILVSVIYSYNEFIVLVEEPGKRETNHSSEKKYLGAEFKFTKFS